MSEENDNFTLSTPFLASDILIKFVLYKGKVIGAWKDSFYIPREKFEKDFLVNKTYSLYKKTRREIKKKEEKKNGDKKE